MGKLPPPNISVTAQPSRPTRRARTQEAVAQVRPPAANDLKSVGKEEAKRAPETARAKGEETHSSTHRAHGQAPKTDRAKQSAKSERQSGATELTSETRTRAPSDDFEPSQTFGMPLKSEPLIPPSVPGGKPRSGVLELLDEAEEPGVFFREREGDGQAGDEEDSELNEAVEEAIQLLFGVRGIHHIGPGEDVEGNPVVLICANTGFGESSLERIPQVVRGFKTLLALPYELLPLRRDRS